MALTYLLFKLRDPHGKAIVVILSAQCTDARGEYCNSQIFKKHPTLKDFAGGDLEKNWNTEYPFH